MAAATLWTSVLDDADDETALLIVRLQLEDVEATSTSTSSDGGSKTDSTTAFETYQNELNQYRAIRFSEAEETALAEAFATAASDAGADAAPKPSTGTRNNLHHQNVLVFRCVVCEDQFDADRCWQAPCQHWYCDGDLENLFRTSMQDKTLYPPRCCTQNMLFDDVKDFLPRELVTTFEGAKEELDDNKPTYCYIETCSTYIGQAGKAESLATCPKCDAVTCIVCKQRSHTGECKEDAAMQETLDLAQAEGWRKCPDCERLVELTIGCNHMTCLCRAQFCYVCGAHWKTCGCPQFEENRLLARGLQIVDRDGGNLEAMVEHLRVNHECTNHRWAYVGGVHDCEECGDTLRGYIYRCRSCQTQLCRRCRYNRA